MFGKKDAKKGKTTRPKQAEQLFKACESGRTNDVHKLLQVSGTSFHINVYNDNGLTPLHLAAESATTASDATMFNFLSICKMLLDSGADPNIGSQAPQNTILHYLAKILIPPSNSSLKIFLETLLTYVISKGGDATKMNREGMSPIHEAAIKGNVDVISFFLNQGTNPNVKSSHGETPLHFAVVSSNEEAVKLLLAKGADPDAAAERGTPREISKKLRLPNIEKLLASVQAKAPSMAPPPDMPPPPAPPPGPPSDGPDPRASYALDEGALNDLVAKISETGTPDRDLRASKPLPAPPNKNKTPSFTPAAVDTRSTAGSAKESSGGSAIKSDGNGELNDLLDELDFGENDDPVLPAHIEEEYEDNDAPDMKFQLDPITSQMCVRAATIDKLVERLSIDRDPASGFRTTLLLTYRSYINAQELMKKLIARFKKCGFESTQIRILNVFKTWVEMYFYDFQEDDQLRAILFDFLDRDVKNPNHRNYCSEIKSTYRDQKDFSFTSNLSVGITGGMAYASPLQFLTMDEAEVSRQLTLIESEIYCAIKPKEILDGAWNKKGKEEAAPHIIALIQHFNNVSKWVVTEILNQSSPKQRAAMIEKIIYLGTELRELGNFNGAMEVLAALNSPAVTRLKKTWELVGEDPMARLDAIQKLMSHNGSYKEYRLVLRDVDPPCLPYLGMYLSDITFIQDGEPNVVENSLINFAKHHKVAQVIGEIQFFQESGHSGKNPKFTAVPGVVEWWRAQLGNLYSEKEAYQVSIKIEPDQGGEVVDTGAMAQLKQDNESLQIRVSQLEQLNREQAEEISVLTEKLKAAQREVRVAKDVADMLRAAQAANRGAPAPSTVANMSFEPAPAAKSLPTYAKPAAFVAPPPPEPVPPPPEPDMPLDAPPDVPPPMPDMPPPDAPPPMKPPAPTPSPAVTRTNDRLQELREKYRARQGAPAAKGAAAPAAEPAMPAAPEAKPAAPAAAKGKAAPATATAASGAAGKKPAPKAAAVVAAPVATPEPEAPAPAAGSTAAALREKFKLNSKGAAASSPALAALKTEESRSSGGGVGRASSGGEVEAAPAEEGGEKAGNADALLASMAALREKYKKPAAGAKPAAEAAKPAPASPASPTAAATAATAAKPPATKPVAIAKPPANTAGAGVAGSPTPKPAPRPKPQPVAVPPPQDDDATPSSPPPSPKPTGKGRPLPKMGAEPKIIMMKPVAPRPKPVAPPPEEEAEAPEQQWDE